jgi:hypothetical protein
MPQFLSVTYNDYSNEKSNVRFQGVDLTAANFDAQVALRNTLLNAIGDITLGVEVKDSIGQETPGSLVPPTDGNAQREKKWLVSYVDDGNPTRSLSIELPCADTSDETYFQGNTDFVDLTNADMAAFVAAFEAYMTAPYTGGSVTVIGMRFVGRRG